MADEKEQPQKMKIGAGHLAAWVRAGHKEISQALVAFPDSNIRPVEEPGLYGNLTPQEILHGKTQYESLLSGYASRGATQQQTRENGVER
jgi:hypothetical protein